LRQGILAARTGPSIPLEGSITGEFRFPEDFAGFGGHFPGYPLVPGIVQVLLAQILIEEVSGAELRLTEVSGAKFLEKLRPETSITVVCRERRPLPESRWEVKLSAAGRLAASFTLQFRTKEE
jgi:3-hydroxyacyl-[acyl-carrier-protein] dehydratase